MKLVVLIIDSDDYARLNKGMIESGFSFTRLASTGGFLKKGNTTLFVGAEDNRIDALLKLVKKNCKTRSQHVFSRSVFSETVIPTSIPIEASSSILEPLSVEAGGATVFILDVEKFIKI